MRKDVADKSPIRMKTWMHGWGDPLLFRMAHVLHRVGFTPNALTISGLALSVLVALLLATGHTVTGGWVLLVAAMVDSLDGTLARLTNQETKFGAFLDSTIDQWADAIVFLGLLWPYLQAGARVEVILIFASLAGSLLVSYTRACAGWRGFECTVGPVGRLERGLVAIVALITKQVTLGLWLVAVLSSLTALRRLYYVWTLQSKKVIESSGQSEELASRKEE